MSSDSAEPDLRPDSPRIAGDDVVVRAKDGDPAAQKYLRHHADELSADFDRFGDPVELAMATLIARFSGEQPQLSGALRKQIVKLREDLLSPDPTSLEKMAADAVLVSWLHMQCLLSMRAPEAGKSLVPSSQLVRAQREAQKCYEGALRSLELVRTKLTPAVSAKSQTKPAPSAKAAESTADPGLADPEPGPKRLKFKLPRSK